MKQKCIFSYLIPHQSACFNLKWVKFQFPIFGNIIKQAFSDILSVAVRSPWLERERAVTLAIIVLEVRIWSNCWANVYFITSDKTPPCMDMNRFYMFSNTGSNPQTQIYYYYARSPNRFVKHYEQKTKGLNGGKEKNIKGKKPRKEHSHIMKLKTNQGNEKHKMEAN